VTISYRVIVPCDQSDPRRVLGQNFFRSVDDARRFASQLKGRDDALVVEVGAGSGMITRVLAEGGNPVVAVEMDPYWARRLDEARLSGVTVVQADFLRWTPPPGRVKIIGNVPFGAGTKILRHCLDLGPRRLDQAVLLLQEEVVLKRVGRYGGNLFNIQWAPWYELGAGVVFSRYGLRPVPDTDTATLLIEPRNSAVLPWGERHDFQDVARAVFSTGHLTLDAALRAVARGGSKRWLARGRLYGGRRVKDLTADEWVALYRARAVPACSRSGGDAAGKWQRGQPRRR
jgi:23S rRNA (adenine-N6)-dimethyltransferase